MWVVPKEEKKRALRAATLSRRNSLGKSEYSSWSRLIQAEAVRLPPYRASHSVALYSPIQNEVGTADILEHAWRRGRRVFYPKSLSNACFEMVEVLSIAEFKTGRFGIQEPTGPRPLAETDHEGLVVFVPGVAFDARGNRLGRGKGWYDRLLRQLGDKAISVGLAYEFQVVEEVPTEPWDEKVRYVVTEKRTIDCAAGVARPGQSF